VRSALVASTTKRQEMEAEMMEVGKGGGGRVVMRSM